MLPYGITGACTGLCRGRARRAHDGRGGLARVPSCQHSNDDGRAAAHRGSKRDNGRGATRTGATVRLGSGPPEVAARRKGRAAVGGWQEEEGGVAAVEELRGQRTAAELQRAGRGGRRLDARWKEKSGSCACVSG
jgi:hypothetical protein